MRPPRILPAIMSGGSGTRLWPQTTDARPKQFHALFDARTLFQETLARVAPGTPGPVEFLPPMVLGNIRHADLIEAQMHEVGLAPSAIVLEPVGCNTAATAAVAAALAREIAPDGLVLLLPADHLIADRDGFVAAIARAAAIADERIVTFGITPTGPETGYGYIRLGAPLSEGVHAIVSFREKPSVAVAREYLASGEYAWNAGMFLFNPDLLLQEFASAADIRDNALAALSQTARTGARIALPPLFGETRSQPLDIAVMEKTARGAVAPCDIGWADVGSWSEIWRHSDRNAEGNAVAGPALVFDSRNNLIRSDGPRVAIAGIENIIVVVSNGEILILPRDRAQDVKKLWSLANPT